MITNNSDFKSQKIVWYDLKIRHLLKFARSLIIYLYYAKIDKNVDNWIIWMFKLWQASMSQNIYMVT